jgi:hypothetical protein
LITNKSPSNLENIIIRLRHQKTEPTPGMDVKTRGLNPFIANRILSLISLPWSERDFSKYIVENPNKLKLYILPSIEGFTGPTESLNSSSDGWVSAKGSFDHLAKTLESLTTQIHDKSTLEYIQTKWTAFFSHAGTPSKKVNIFHGKKKINQLATHIMIFIF